MSTRSHIVLNKDGKYYVIYCHWDGYPSNNGKILLKHYNNEAKVFGLVQLGDISSLGQKIGEKHNFDNPPEGIVNAYGRDRGENWDDVKPRIYNTKEEVLEVCSEDFTYLFENGKWQFRHWEKSFKKLTLKDCKE